MMPSRMTRVMMLRVCIVGMILVMRGAPAATERQDNTDVIKRIGRLSQKDAHGDTPLCKAIKAGDAALVQKLLDEGANPNAPDAKGRMPLRHAMVRRSNDPEVVAQQHKIVQALYYAWADDPTLTPDALPSIVAFKAIIEADRALPIHVRAVHGSLCDEENKDSVDALLTAQIPVTLVPLVREYYGSAYSDSAYALLAARIPAPLVKLVREYYGSAESVITHPLKLRSQLSHRDRNQCLVDASFNGRETRVLEALYVGANINARDKRGWIALGSAAFNSNREVVKLLLWFGANVEKRNDSDETPLYEAMVRGDAQTISLLLRSGADVEAISMGQTPLHRAVIYEREEAVRLLLQHGANIEATDDKGETSLVIAKRRYKSSDRDDEYEIASRGKIVKILRDHGARDSDARDWSCVVS